MITFSGPVVLFPLPCFFSVNYAKTINPYPIHFFLGIIASIGKNCSLHFEFFYRFQQSASPDSNWRFIDWSMLSGYKLVLFHGLWMLSTVTLVCIPIWLQFPDQKDQQQYLISLDSEMATVFRLFPSTICFSHRTNLFLVLFAGNAVLLTLTLVCIASLLRLYKNMGKISRAIQKLQEMLFRSLVAQLSTSLIFVIIPMSVLLLSSYGHSNVSLSIIAFIFMSTHCLVNCCMIIAFITPYRKYFRLCLPSYNIHPKNNSSK